MTRLAACLALLGLRGVPAVEDEECVGESCTAPADDTAMLQFAKHPGLAVAGKSSALNSKPFFGSRSNSSLLTSEQGRLVIDEDGVLNTYYLPGATTLNDGKTVKYTPPYRYYLMREPTTDYSDASKFYKPYFPGKTFSVDMDFGANGASCGCNLNFYLVDMPVASAGQDHDHYCDAQCFPGLGCCSEFDMNEGNMQVQQITNHACTHNYGGHPDWACHKWGEPEVKSHTSEFGPGGRIDSRKPFTFSQRFDKNGNDATITTTISQNGQSLVMRMGPGNAELNAMLRELEKGLAFVTGYWFAKDMNWMDGEGCGSGTEHCNMNPALLSNWRLTSNDGPAPAPAPPSPGPTPPAPPVPAPTTGGKCCWGADHCSGCNEDASNWCNQGQGNCEGPCNGHWCSA